MKNIKLIVKALELLREKELEACDFVSNVNEAANILEQLVLDAENQEPVAYQYFDSESGRSGLTFCYAEAINIAEIEDNVSCLYEEPQPNRKPMSEEEAAELINGLFTSNGFYTLLRLIRMVENKHNIL